MPTKGDHEASRLLLALYHSKTTPPMIQHLILQLLWDAAKFYGVALPNQITKKWRPFWPLLLAKLRVHGSLPTRINYTWQPTEDEEAALDADDALQAQADALFDARTIDPIGETLNELINQTGCNTLDQRELFRVAWPLMLDALQQMNARPEGSAANE